MKKTFAIPLMIVLVVGLVFSGCAAPAPEAPAPAKPEVIELIRADWYPLSDPMCPIAALFCDAIEEATEGRVRIRYIPGGALFGGKEAYQSIVEGVADMSMIFLAYTPKRFPLLAAYNLPLPILDVEVGTRIFNELIEKYKPAELADTHLLYSYFCDDNQLYTIHHPVWVPEDMKGIKVRATGVKAELYELMGATPINIPTGEIPGALQKGIVNAVGAAGMQVETMELAPPLKYCTYLSAGNAAFNLTMNLDAWNSLPPDIQKIFDEVSEEYSYIEANNFAKCSQAGHNWAVAQGVEVIKYPPEIMKARDEAVQVILEGYYADWEAKGLPGRKFVDDLYALNEKYMAEKK
ncbi:Solute-binding protein [subsurface metagenome]